MIPKSWYRRSTLKAIVRAKRRVRGATVLVSRVASIAILLASVVTIWGILSFARVGIAGANEPAQQAKPSRIPILERPVDTKQAPKSTVLSKRDMLVYVVTGDETHFHASSHDGEETQRRAIPLASAIGRGMTPCEACFRNKCDELKNAPSR